MREIVFRGKDLHSDRWILGDYSVVEGRICIGVERDNEQSESCASKEWIPVDPETVGQFTGFTDIYGRYVFEGDVVHLVWDEPSPHLFLVEWYQGAWQASNPKAKTSPNECESLLGLYVDEVLVIGNVHDSPELRLMVKVSGA